MINASKMCGVLQYLYLIIVGTYLLYVGNICRPIYTWLRLQRGITVIASS